MTAIIYKNLNRGDWSVAAPAGRDGLNRGKVIDHADSVTISAPVFVVKESGRLRVVSRHCREVHAWIVGTIVDAPPPGIGREITFNPYRAPTFHFRDTGAPVAAATHIEFTGDGRAMAYGAS
jgi:hypothetical protein